MLKIVDETRMVIEQQGRGTLHVHVLQMPTFVLSSFDSRQCSRGYTLQIGRIVRTPIHTIHNIN